jgi:hypothetical protein
MIHVSTKCILSVFFLFTVCQSVSAQKNISGVVKSADNGQPVAGASVFLNNTSVGTVTSNTGAFNLNLPIGKFDLVISSIGYITQVKTISSQESTDHFIIQLQPEVKELQAVVVEPFEKDGWAKWGQLFLDNFIGISSMAKECRIKNKETIRFRYSKTKQIVTAHTTEPLIIENDYLGYKLQYLLEEFSYNFKTKMIFYVGYPLFQPMKGNNAKMKRWERRRAELYTGSMMHFMRSLYRNTLLEEGFEVRRLEKLQNMEKKRVNAMYADILKSAKASGATTLNLNSTSLHPDSNAYYQTIMKQTDHIDVLYNTVLPGDSIAFAVNTTTAGMDFPDYLQVLYKHKTAHPDYIKMFPKSSTAVLSQIQLINGNPIEVQANGMYYSPLELVSSGYWSWSEKISTMLPFDYWPKN